MLALEKQFQHFFIQTDPPDFSGIPSAISDGPLQLNPVSTPAIHNRRPTAQLRTIMKAPLRRPRLIVRNLLQAASDIPPS